MKAWEDLKDSQVDGKFLFDYFGQSNGKRISTMVNAKAAL